MEVLAYQTPTGRIPFSEWIEALDSTAGSIIENRLKRLRQGQLGDHRYIGDGVWEFRVFYGPGYRMYYLRDGDRLIILLLGGDKDSQWRDIRLSKIYASDYWLRK